MTGPQALNCSRVASTQHRKCSLKGWCQRVLTLNRLMKQRDPVCCAAEHVIGCAWHVCKTLRVNFGLSLSCQEWRMTPSTPVCAYMWLPSPDITLHYTTQPAGLIRYIIYQLNGTTWWYIEGWGWSTVINFSDTSTWNWKAVRSLSQDPGWGILSCRTINVISARACQRYVCGWFSSSGTDANKIITQYGHVKNRAQPDDAGHRRSSTVLSCKVQWQR